MAPDGTVNQNSGAESTIHGLLTMLALDSHPRAQRIARTATVRELVGTETVQAEDATLTGGATAEHPDPLWTGESAFGGTGYASLPDGGGATLSLGAHPRSLLLPVVDLHRDSSALTTFRAGDTDLGRVRSGDIGAQGDSPAPGALLPRTLSTPVPSSATTVTASTSADGGDAARLDAVMVLPLVSRLVLGGAGHGTALLRSAARSAEPASVSVPGRGRADVWSYDGRGRLLRHSTSTASDVRVRVAAGGVTLVRR